MAGAAITLEDIRTVVREESLSTDKIRQIVREEFQKNFKPAFEETFEPWALAIQQDFSRIHERLDEHDARFDRLDARVESLGTDISEVKIEVKGIKRIVGQHSKEIIELKAQLA